MPLNIAFMGTPEFAVPTLDLLIKSKFNIVKVYTQPPKKSKSECSGSSSISSACSGSNDRIYTRRVRVVSNLIDTQYY